MPIVSINIRMKNGGLMRVCVEPLIDDGEIYDVRAYWPGSRGKFREIPDHLYDKDKAIEDISRELERISQEMQAYSAEEL